MFKFHFHIPNYVENSNGILTLWEAAYQFSLLRPVTISSFYHGSTREYPIPNRYLVLINSKPELKNNTIVIYPDAAQGNPLNAKKVARYMLAKEYILNGNPIQFEENDFIFSYSNAVNSSADQYNILLHELTSLKNFRTEKIKGKVAVYYGKCRVGIEIPQYKNILKQFKEIVIITRTNPSSKEVMYREMASSELFISFDPLSSLCYEATLLGTPVILMDDVSKFFYNNFNFKLHGFYYQENISDLKRILDSHSDLYGVANQELVAQLSMVTKSTNLIIKKIENHFLNPGKSLKERYQQEDLQFYIEQWKCSPILNCTNLKTVYGFHLIHSRPKLYFLLRSIHLLLWMVIGRLRTLKIKYYELRKRVPSFRSLYPQNEYNCLEYSLNQMQCIQNYKDAIFASKKDTDLVPILPVYRMSINKFIKIMRFLCI